MAKTLAQAVVHTIPSDMRSALLKSTALTDLWNGLTPLGRNEWVCWVTSVKKAETRSEHIHRLTEDLQKGKRRPCCWPGCPHRDKKK